MPSVLSLPTDPRPIFKPEHPDMESQGSIPVCLTLTQLDFKTCLYYKPMIRQVPLSCGISKFHLRSKSASASYSISKDSHRILQTSLESTCRSQDRRCFCRCKFYVQFQTNTRIVSHFGGIRIFLRLAVRRHLSICCRCSLSPSQRSGFHSYASGPNISLLRCITHGFIPTRVPALKCFPQISAPPSGTTRSMVSPIAGWRRPASLTQASR